MFSIETGCDGNTTDSANDFVPGALQNYRCPRYIKAGIIEPFLMGVQNMIFKRYFSNYQTEPMDRSLRGLQAKLLLLQNFGAIPPKSSSILLLVHVPIQKTLEISITFSLQTQ